MSCRGFLRWLDDGRPAEGDDRARAHAGGCAACAAALEADLVLERLLGAPAPPAPEGFTERLMARLPARPALATPLPAPALPWWLRAVTDPAAVLALVLAGLVSWRGGPLWTAALAAGADAGGWLPGWLARAAELPGIHAALAALARPEARLGLEVALACVLLAAAPAIAATSRRAMSRAVAPA